MAKAIALIASAALCILAIAAITPAHAYLKREGEYIVIEGRVYCDTCRATFETKLSRNIEGANVMLDCRDPTTLVSKFKSAGYTNSTGYYTIHSNGDHSDEICEVSLKDSPDESCNEIMDSTLSKVRVDLALDEGIHQKVRYANPLGFLAKEALPGCKKILDDMGIVPIVD